MTSKYSDDSDRDSRDRRRSYSDDEESKQYSDDSFYSDDDRSTIRSNKKASPRRSNTLSASTYDSYSDREPRRTKSYDRQSTYTHKKDKWKPSSSSDRKANVKVSWASAGTKKNMTKAYGKKKGPGGRMSKASSNQGASPRQQDYTTKRLLSARRMKINELKNELDDTKEHLRDMQNENKVLKRQNALQDKALNKFEGTENDMPQMIQRHSEEVRSLKDQLKKHKDRANANDRMLSDKDKELTKTKKLLRKMTQLVEEKELGERDELARKLTKLEIELEDREKRVKDLERHVEHLQKNHKHELGIERARHKETQHRLRDLQEQHEKTQMNLREKEKELDVRNIYANRLMKPPHKLNSTRSTPIPSIRERRRSRDPSPRDKAKSFDEQRRTQERRQREEEDDILVNGKDEPVKEDVSNWAENQRRMQEEEEEEERKWKEERERHKREAEQREREERDRWQREQDESNRQREDRERRDQQEREERERREREEREDREREERGERERQEREDRERREREETERRAREEAQRLANDKAEQERLRQKELLLAKMKELDTKNDQGVKRDSDKTMSPQRRRRQQEEDASMSPSRRNYTFTKPIENLHSGMPAYDHNPVPVLEKNKRRGFFAEEDDDSEGYQPSFNGRRANQNKPKNNFLFDDEPKSKPVIDTKKSDLMADLFGNSGVSKTKSPLNNNNDDDIFQLSPSTKRKTESKRRSTREDSQTQLFGGGSAIVDNDKPSSGSLLPRRSRQPSTTLASRPIVNSIEDIDAELEEVIL